jgi:hypothetical protein
MSNSNNKDIPPPRLVKKTGFFSGLTSGIGNLLGSSSSPPPPPNNQLEDDSFKYSIEISDEFPLKTEFTNLAKAINDKNDILKLYQDLLPALQYLDKLLTELGIERVAINDQKRDLETRIGNLNDEKTKLQNDIDNLNNRQFGPTRDDFESNELRKKNIADALAQKDSEIASAQAKLKDLENASVVNKDTIDNISKLLEDATKYINGMKPNNKNDILEIRKLVNKMQDGLNANKDAKGYLKVDDNRDSAFEFVNPLIGGYRYSSSQMRRKSTARRSSASGSSSSKRRRNKKRTAKKMMLGGKRMKKSKSTKRKHNKKH